MASDDKLPWGLTSSGLTPGSMKNISDTKLKAFNIGSMNVKKVVTKKEQEDLRKKKEEEETAEVYKDFLDSFDDAKKGLKKAWVKGGVVNSEKGEIVNDKAESKLYRPTSKLLEKKLGSSSSEKKKEEKVEKPSLAKKKPTAAEKRKTNLELFKEELKVIQEERQERRKVKKELGLNEDPVMSSNLDDSDSMASGASMGLKSAAASEDYRAGNYTYETDVQTTNLYLGNINPKMTEMQLCEVFGKFGPLASVKVMWPRTDEERARGRNCGFVAYMNRRDGERALASLQGKDIMDFEMKLGWGKAVPIPPHPVYIPPALSELTMPPPPSGLPFNAQPNRGPAAPQYGSVPPPLQDNGASQQPMKDPALMTAEELDKTLANAVVKVVIPTERVLLNTIHRMIEFVVREGPMFEAMIMNRELQNPLYRFLFENQSPAHIYYRWKLFSVLQGDSPYKWRAEVFRMFKGGSVWRPPQMNPYTQGMPEELIDSTAESSNNETEYIPSLLDDILLKPAGGPAGGGLTESQRDRLEDMLRDLLPERARIGDAMVWCLEHAESAEEIVECIAESLSILQTPIPKKIARLFLISDVLHNCSARVPHASFFRKQFEIKLPEIFKDIHDTYEKIDARLKAEQFKQRVMACFRAWEDWSVYTSDYLINLQNVFLGLVASSKEPASPSVVKEEELDEPSIEDVDGVPLEDIDGAPLDESASMGGSLKSIVPYGDDIDGEPVDEASDKKPAKPELKFIPSKWETVDESELESQAMTVSKWDLLDQKNKEEELKKKSLSQSVDVSATEDDIDGRPMEDDDDDDDVMVVGKSLDESSRSWTGIDLSALRDEDGSTMQRNQLSEQKRAKLREIEVRVMKYQDELEAGKRTRKSGVSITEQVEQYRRKQLSKEEERDKGKERDKRRSGDRDHGKEWSERSRGEQEKRSHGRRRSEEKSPGRRTSRGGGRDEERYGRDSDRRLDRSRDERRHRDETPEGSSSKGVRGSERRDRSPDEGWNYRADETRKSKRAKGSDSPNGSDYSRSFSAASSMGVASGLVSYTRSQSSDSVSADDEERSERRVRRGSPRRSLKVSSPVRSKRSRSRSPSSRHKHKKSKR